MEKEIKTKRMKDTLRPAKTYEEAVRRQEKADRRQLESRTCRALGVFWISLDGLLAESQVNDLEGLETSDHGEAQRLMFEVLDRNAKPEPEKWQVLLAQELEKFSERDLIMWRALLQSPHNVKCAAKIAHVTYNVMTGFTQRLGRRLWPAYEALKSLHHWRYN